MAFEAGNKSRVFFGGRALDLVLAEAGINIDIATLDTTTLSDSWMTAIADDLAAQFTGSGFYDVSKDDLQAALGTDGGVLTWCPGGAAVGDAARLIPVSATAYGQSSQRGDVVAFSWDAISQDALELGEILHANTEDTNTTTGSSRDGSAASTTGWTAHLHVLAVDGGSWVVKLEDSANNSAWADVSGGAFTAVTAAGGERIRSAAGATLRRYVRYTATRTGGSAGDGITFALAVARSRQ